MVGHGRHGNHGFGFLVSGEALVAGCRLRVTGLSSVLGPPFSGCELRVCLPSSVLCFLFSVALSLFLPSSVAQKLCGSVAPSSVLDPPFSEALKFWGSDLCGSGILPTVVQSSAALASGVLVLFFPRSSMQSTMNGSSITNSRINPNKAVNTITGSLNTAK